MQCTRPIDCVRIYDEKTRNGFPSLSFRQSDISSANKILHDNCNNDYKLLKTLYGLELMKVPCRKCPSCKSNWCREWAVRAYHESLLYDSNLFITLTYNEINLPDIYGWSNRHRRPIDDFQGFMKRFRINLLRQLGEKIRFFSVFEYGSNFSRPHHHAIIFNCTLPDMTFWKLNGKYPIYRSPLLEKSWTYGYSTVQNVDFNVCAYVARYCMKKIDVNEEWYDGRDCEFNLMSRRPGLAHDWFQRYWSDVYNQDFVQLKEYATRPPKYYDRLFDSLNHERMEEIKNDRRQFARTQTPDSPKRLADIEKYQFAKLSRMKRSFENEIDY